MVRLGVRRVAVRGRFRAYIFLLALLVLPEPARAAVITKDTTWSGEVAVTEDVLVPEGVSLTIAAGTRVLVTPAESTKTDPEYLSPLTEITIRGKLTIQGRDGSPVSLVPAGDKGQSWAGIIIDGGTVDILDATISDADAGVTLLKGSLSMNASTLTKNRYGLVVYGQGTTARMSASHIRGNDYGLLLLNGGKVDAGGSEIKDNRKKDIFSGAVRDYRPALREFRPVGRETLRVYRDEALLGLTVWRNRVEVQGTVRVPENSRLIILPGTVVEFGKKDTNHDNIGENGLLIQGTIIAKGTRENPIVFRSAEKQRGMGDWDSINIMNSDMTQNLLEFCQIEDAYRGLHFHFSNVAVVDSVLRNNYRGIQFQESVVAVRGSHFYGNKSGLQARDSDITFTGNLVHRNYSGINVLRNSIVMSDNIIANNFQDGLRLREGIPMVEGNLIDGNRHGLMVTDSFYGSYVRNVVSHNLESGVLLRGADGVDLRENIIQSNGLNGINIQDSSAFIQGNLISDNTERGIGVVSFQGIITGNNIVSNGLYNLGIDGASDVSARMNWWGDGDVRRTIFDRENDPSKGRAEYLPVMERPAAVPWPLPAVLTDTSWHGDILVDGEVIAQSGVNLTVAPGARVLFSKGAGLTVRGKITARGEGKATISFAGRQGMGRGEWSEILLDHATGSAFSNCRFENATWALHSHFTDLKVEMCSFVNNTGGLRFTSGPLEVRRSVFQNNEIGIRSFRGNARVTENEITGNEVGIFVREKGGGLKISRNNLFGNTAYNIRLGDFNDEDVDAKDNWWGQADPAVTIYDARREPGIGKVLYEPAAERRFEIRIPAARESGL